MAREDAPSAPVEVHHPQISLVGTVCNETVSQLRDGLKQAEKGEGPSLSRSARWAAIPKPRGG
jgi:hypothetical protein